MTPPVKPFYITTPIYYVNDRPHIGHCYTTLVADIAARFTRLIRGADGPGVFLLTGTDEHADKVVTAAAAHGLSPQDWADRNAVEFRKAFEFMRVGFDDFIRTTEPRHKERVSGYIKALLGSGAIYKGEYTGWYDPGQEEYVTESAARESGYKSRIDAKALVKRTEPCYFFRLSGYQQRLLDHLASHPAFVQPDARRSEVLGRLRPPAALNDVPVSRPVTDDPATQWGIRIPGDPGHRLYVWIDALFNYLTVADAPERRSLWPADVHLIGKDILWFHAVIWPALLMALREAPGYGWVGLPRAVFGHGWWVSEGQKMSKSLGNFIDLEKLRAYADRYALDALRWYLATQGPLAGNDADFSHAKFVEVYNADLANGIGNSTSRVANMIGKYCGGVVPTPGSGGPPSEVRSLSPRLVAAAIDAAGRLDLALSMHQATAHVRLVDSHINTHEPFRMAKRLDSDPSVRPLLDAILYECAEALRIASLLFYPAMPFKMAELWRRWNCNHLRDPANPDSGFVAPLSRLAEWGGEFSIRPGTSIIKGDALFMRADPSEAPPR
jgi:methionyl-tRNA synthetase